MSTQATALTFRGHVVWFKPEKGYGFIRRSDTQTDVFVHHSEINCVGYRSLEQGQLVEFEIGPSPHFKPGKVEAKNVTVVEEIEGNR